MKRYVSILLAMLLLPALIAGCGDHRASLVNSDTHTADIKTYLKTSPEKPAEYNEAITSYNLFLNNQATVKSNDGTSRDVLGYGASNDGIHSFALGDVNYDDIPELLIHADRYAILALDAKGLTERYVSMSWQRIHLLENGAVLDTHSIAGGVTYRYITFDAHGIQREIDFTKPDEQNPDQTFYFGEDGALDKVSKERWENLTAPYFESAKNTIELDWIEWEHF